VAIILILPRPVPDHRSAVPRIVESMSDKEIEAAIVKSWAKSTPWEADHMLVRTDQLFRNPSGLHNRDPHHLPATATRFWANLDAT